MSRSPRSSTSRPVSRSKPRMSVRGWNHLFADVFVVALAIAISYVVWGLAPHAAAAPAPAPTTTAPAPPAPPDYIYLAIKGGCAWCAAPFNGSDQYTPANFTVPSHTLLIFTITNYDNGQNPVPSAVAQVFGVLGGIAYQNAAPPASWGTPATSIPVANVSHTFSALPQKTTAGWNVPIHEADGPQGYSVTFEMYLNTTGTVAWQCDAPCDGWSMGEPGFMSGTITVT